MVRNTVQRALVYEAVCQLKNHPTAEDIYAWVTTRNPKVSRGTVYRNLGCLAQEGKIRRVPLPNTSDRFDFTLAPHYHIRCTRCGKLEDVQIPYHAEADGQARKATGWDCRGHEIIFEGECPDCKKERNSK